MKSHHQLLTSVSRNLSSCLIICIFITSFINFIYIQETIATTTTNASTAPALATVGQAMYGTNMSQVMSLNQASASATFMTNTSLTQQLNHHHHQNNSSKFLATQQQAASKSSPINNASLSYNNKQSVKGAGNNRQQPVIGPTNSPAFNSRLKSAPIQATSSAVASSMMSGSKDGAHLHHGKKLTADNQMAADDIHETQAFMTINSVSTTVNGGAQTVNNTNSSSSEGNNKTASNQQITQMKDKGMSTSRQQQALLESTSSTNDNNSSSNKQLNKADNNSIDQNAMTMMMMMPIMPNASGAGYSSPMEGQEREREREQHSMNIRQTNQKSSQAGQKSSAASSSPSSSRSSSQQLQQQLADNGQQLEQGYNQWRPPAAPKEVPKFLQHPYMEGLSQRQLQRQLEQQRYLHLAELEQQQQQALQLEKPNGYSYDQTAQSASSSYTHTSQLNPVRQEVLLAEKLRQKQLNYYQQQQPATPSAHSVFGLNVLEQQQQQQQQQQQRSLSPFASQQQQPIEQLSISGKSTAPAIVQPQFGPTSQQQSNLYSSPPQSQSSLKPPAAHHGQHVFGVLPPGPHISITGTAANPCKPASTLLHGQQQDLAQSSIQQLMNSNNNNDIASAAQAFPNFLQPPKYIRVGDGTRLRSALIFKVIRADSLTDCELACTRASSLADNNLQDTCRSFNYRAYFAAENCELSRHDWRQLKLEDSAQFEQHTQFDFYALDNNNLQQQQPMTSAALTMQSASSSNINIIQQQQLNNPFPFESDCLDVAQACSQDGMEFTLRTNEPFNGRIYTYGFYDSCFTDGDGSTSSVLRISRSNGFPRCGTQQIGDLMTNIVVVQFNDFVQTTRDKKYNLTCYFSGPGEAVVTSNYLDTKIDERSHPIQIEHLPPQNVITSNVHLRVLYRGQPTNTIAVGDLLTFRLETRHNNNNNNVHNRARANSSGQLNADHSSGNYQQQQQQQQSEIFATNVIAKDPYSGKQVQLIDSRGCPIDPVNVFPELQRTPDGALESEFYAFKIPDSNFLIFQATVRTCKAPCEPVICQTPLSSSIGTSNNNNHNQLNSVINNQQGYQGAIKGSYLMAPPQQHSHLSAALMHGAGPLSVPSWGKRKRRKRNIGKNENNNVNDNDNNFPAEPTKSSGESYFDDDDDVKSALYEERDLNLGESVEHIVPVRMQPPAGSSMIGADTARRPKQLPTITTVRRPELSEAEEEVKEMFRVYLSRAEMINNHRNNQLAAAGHPQSSSLASGGPLLAKAEDVYEHNNNQHQNQPLLDVQASLLAGQLSRQQLIGEPRTELITAQTATICITQSGFYILLFTVISLTMVTLSIVFVSFYVTKKAKFSISDSLASSTASNIHF